MASAVRAFATIMVEAVNGVVVVEFGDNLIVSFEGWKEFLAGARVDFVVGVEDYVTNFEISDASVLVIVLFLDFLCLAQVVMGTSTGLVEI